MVPVRCLLAARYWLQQGVNLVQRPTPRIIFKSNDFQPDAPGYWLKTSVEYAVSLMHRDSESHISKSDVVPIDAPVPGVTGRVSLRHRLAFSLLSSNYKMRWNRLRTAMAHVNLNDNHYQQCLFHFISRTWERGRSMKLQHLCNKHCELVRCSAETAVQLWRRAYEQGISEFQVESWDEAKRSFGAAWEISLLRFALDINEKTPGLGPKEFGAVARYNTIVLCRLHELDAAEICLRRAHDGLLHWSQEPKLAYSERMAAYGQLSEFRQKLTALLNFTGRQTYAKCLDLMALQLGRQAARRLFH
jgi:hypothetical protein